MLHHERGVFQRRPRVRVSQLRLSLHVATRSRPGARSGGRSTGGCGEKRSRGRRRYVCGRLCIRFAGGHGGFPIIGSPDDVANELAQISADGFDGYAFSFVNYADELPFFAAEVLPRLERRGLRAP